ncbi:MAG: glycosyl hydrolase [Planctomycetota bacterium]
MDRQEFKAPSAAYRGVTLWMLNDKLETDQVVEQLESFHRAGWGAVIGRTFNGLLTEYLSDDWMAMTDAIVARAGELGMRVWLQAAYMPSAVPDLDPAVQYKGLTARPADAAIEDNAEVLARDETYAYCKVAQPTVLDLLNGPAVTNYLNSAYRDVWYERFGEQFGKTIEAVWVDEPHFRPKLLPWSDRIEELFGDQWGYAITDHLPSLFRPVGDYDRVRHHYWRTAVGMFMAAYFKHVGQWCDEHNIKFAGHLMGEDTLNNQIAWTGATMPAYEYMQLPGIDHLTMSLRWPSGHKKFLLTPKQATSVADQMGKREMLAEMYAVSSHRITFAERKRIAEWLMVLGINYRCLHGSFYSMRGRRKRIYVPHLSYQQPWWSDNRPLADYFARLSYVLRQGRPRVDVLVVHPVESAFCLHDPMLMDRPHDREHEPEDVRKRDDELVGLCDNLLGLQRDFHFGDETLMAKHGSVDAADLRVGEMAYKAVLLPSMITIRRTTLDLLNRFAAGGGTILLAGEFPARIDGVTAGDDEGLAELRRVVRTVANEREALAAALDRTADAPVTLEADDAEGVWVQVRQVDDQQVYFIVNTNPDAGVDGTLALRGRGRVAAWNLRTGEIDTCPQTPDDGVVRTPLSLAPLGSSLLVLDTAAEPRAVPAVTRREVARVELAERMAVRRDRPNALTLDACRLRRGDGAWSEPLPIITHQRLLTEDDYRGPITLRFTFDVRAVPGELWAVVEDAERYAITINGRAVAREGDDDYIDRAFHPVDIAAGVVDGENTLELSIDFRPLPQASFALASLYEVAEGVELESIYLIGSFAVEATEVPEAPSPNCVRLAPSFALTAESTTAAAGDLTRDGYPFFAGRVTLSDTVTLAAPSADQRVLLTLPGLDAPLAHVRVNGQAAASIWWPPYETDITDLVRAGDNTIEIELVSSLRNLLGPHHRSTGEADSTWHTSFADTRPTVGRIRPEDGVWTDDYCCIPFGLRGRAAVVTVAEETS